MQVGHQLDVAGDVLAHLIDEKDEPKTGLLALDVGVHLFGKVLDADPIVGAILVEDALGTLLWRAGRPSIGGGNVVRLQQRLLPASLPGQARHLAENPFELVVLTATVQIALKLGDVSLFAIVAAHLVKDFHKHRQQGVDLGLADHVRLLVDVEEDAL